MTVTVIVATGAIRTGTETGDAMIDAVATAEATAVVAVAVTAEAGLSVFRLLCATFRWTFGWRSVLAACRLQRRRYCSTWLRFSAPQDLRAKFEKYGELKVIKLHANYTRAGLWRKSGKRAPEIRWHSAQLSDPPACYAYKTQDVYIPRDYYTQ